MACGAGAECLRDHVYPWLNDPRRAGDRSYRALCPGHDDTSHSLSVSLGDNGRVILHCFAQSCSDRRAWAALIDCGVSPGCVTLPAAEMRALEEEAWLLIFSKDTHAHKVLRLAALLKGYPDLPKGNALEELAEDCGVGTREAYKARRSDLHR